MLGPHQSPIHFRMNQSRKYLLFGITGFDPHLFQNILKSEKLWKLHTEERWQQVLLKTEFWNLKKT